MKSLKECMCLYAVTDRKTDDTELFLKYVEDSLIGGVTCLQLREKHADDREFLSLAKKLKPLCEQYGVPFIINDNVRVAVECGADGVHVGQSDMAAGDVRALIGDKMILGVSAQTLGEALLAENSGADYLGVGAVFPTSTKADADDVPLDTLREITSAVNIPVVAIGGITLENIPRLSGTGVDGIAVVSAIYSQNNIKAAAEKLLGAVKGIIT